MSSGDEPSGWRRLTQGAPLAVMLAAGLLIAYELMPDLEVLAIAVLMALAIRSIVRVAKRFGAPTWIAAITTLGMMGAAGVFLWLVVLPNLLQQAEVLTSAVPGYLDTLSELSAQLHDSVSFVPDLSQDIGQLGNLFSPALASLPQLLSNLTQVTVRAIVAVALALYMAFDSGSLALGILRLVPNNRREDAKELLGNLEVRLRGWISGTAIAMLIIGGGAGLGLWIIGIPLALSFGVLAGFLEIIPYFGVFVGAVLPILVALTISPIKAGLVVGLFVLLHEVDVNLIQPQVLGRYVRLHPVVVIISFLFLGDLLGFIGLLLAVPAATVLATLVDEVISRSPAHIEK